MLRIVIVTLLLALPSCALAQLPNLQLDVNGTQIYTNEEFISDQRGIGFTLSKRIADKALLKLEFDRFNNRTAEQVRIYDGFPWTEFRDEWFHESRHFWTLEFALLRTVSFSSHTFFNVGGGFVYGGFDETWRSASDNREYDFDTDHCFGLVIEMEVLITTSDDFPAACRFGFAHKFLGNPEMTTYYSFAGGGGLSGTGAPEKLTTTEFSLSIGWVISR